MNRSSSIYKQIFKEYEKDRDNAAKQLAENKIKIYNLVPRIAEIDKQLALMSIDITKSIINTPDMSENLVEQLLKKNNILLAERDSLLSCDVLQNQGFSSDSLQLQYNCDSCKDTGYIEHIPCHCFKQKMINIAYDQSNVADIIKFENFNNFNINYYSEKVQDGMKISPRDNISRIYSACLRFVNDFKLKFDNLLLYGSSGLGKTFLCNCIAKKLLDAGFTVLYVTAFSLFKMVEENKFYRDENNKSNEYLDSVLNVDLFILDDLGTEFSTVLSSSELFNIINSRLIEKKPTVISTNLAPSDWVRQYSDRIVSRIHGNYTLLKFFGDDIRIKRKYLQNT